MLEIILVQGFCLLKIKITQFPDRFCLQRLKSDINVLSTTTNQITKFKPFFSTFQSMLWSLGIQVFKT